jgi:hypothetical protein
VDDQILPPFAEPTGPLNADETVLDAYARERYVGHSPRFHVEGPTLMVDRMDAAALRVGPNTILVRIDLPEEQTDAKPLVEQALGRQGLCRLDEDSWLAAPVAIQVLGLRLSSWDLWGSDLEESMAVLRLAAAGDECRPIGH